MGYTTTFKGQLDITPAVNSRLALKIDAFCKNPDHAGVGFGGFRCDWLLKGFSALTWNGSEKSYDMFEWLQLINKKFLEPNGHTLSGVMYAHGERTDDQWKIIATPDAEGKTTKLNRVDRPTEW